MSGKPTAACWLLLSALLLLSSGCSLFRGRKASDHNSTPLHYVDLGPQVGQPQIPTHVPLFAGNKPPAPAWFGRTESSKEPNSQSQFAETPIRTATTQPSQTKLADQTPLAIPFHQEGTSTQFAQERRPRSNDLTSASAPPPPAPPGFEEPSPTPIPPLTSAKKSRHPAKLPPAAELSLEPVTIEPQPSAPPITLDSFKEPTPTPPPPPIPPRQQLANQRTEAGKPSPISQTPRKTIVREIPPTAVTDRREFHQTSDPENWRNPEAPHLQVVKSQSSNKPAPQIFRVPIVTPLPPTALTARRDQQQEAAPDNQPGPSSPNLQITQADNNKLPPPVSPYRQLKPVGPKVRQAAAKEPKEHLLSRKTLTDVRPTPRDRPRQTTKASKRLVPRPLPANGLKPVNRVTAGRPAGNLKTLHLLAAESYVSINSYIAKFRRREVVHGTNRPEELMLLKFSKRPWSIYLKWLGGSGKGRECVYVRGKHGNKLYTKTAAGDIPLVPAGKIISLSTNSPLVRSKSRHSITHAGVGNLIDRFGTMVGLVQKQDFRRGSLRYLGLVKRPEFKKPVEAALQTIPPGAEELLPHGGRRFWYFDTKLRFPVLVITQDARQREVEYYCYEVFMFPGRLGEDDFDPKTLWGE